LEGSQLCPNTASPLRDVIIAEVEQRVIDSFSNVFHAELRLVSIAQLEGERVAAEAARVV
jgi:hypothetical protein